MDNDSLPVMAAKNNKETINLLDLTTDSESSISDIVLTTRKKKVKRRYRSGASTRDKYGSSCGCGRSQTRVAALWLAAILITFWLLALSWLAAILHNDIQEMYASVRSVIAGNENVPDTLQKYHSLSRDLQNNQTIIFANLNDIKLQIANFTTQLSTLQYGLHDVQNTVKAAPELSSVPEELKLLQKEQATIGSHVNDLEATVTSLKSSNTRIQDVQNNLLANITTLENALATLANNTQHPEAVLSDESKAQIKSMRAEITQLVKNLSLLAENSTQNFTWTTDNRKADLKHLDAVREQMANLSARTKSLENECTMLNASNAELEEKLKQLENNYILSQTSTNKMLESISKFQNLTANGTAQDASQKKKVLSDKDVNELSVTKLRGQITDEEEAHGKSLGILDVPDPGPVEQIPKHNTGSAGTT